MYLFLNSPVQVTDVQDIRIGVCSEREAPARNRKWEKLRLGDNPVHRQTVECQVGALGNRESAGEMPAL
jgi:hypothetical protein